MKNLIKQILTALLIVLLGCAAAFYYFRFYRLRPMAASAAPAPAVYQCPVHPHYFAEKAGQCPLCGKTLIPASAPDSAALNRAVIRLEPEILAKTSLRTAVVQRRNLEKMIRVPATILPDERAVHVVTATLMGYAENLLVNYTGQTVAPGQPLAEIYSPELFTAQQEYLLAFQALRGAEADPKSPAWQLCQSIRHRLLNLGLADSGIKTLEEKNAPLKTLTLYAPAGGIITEKAVVAGQSFMAGTPLYKIVDFSTVWVQGGLSPKEMALVALQDRVEVLPDYLPSRVFRGVVTYLAPFLDSGSQTAKLRVEVANTPDLLLKPGSSAVIQVFAPAGTATVAIPETSVVRLAKRNIIVLFRGNNGVEPRDVQLGKNAGGYVEVLSGALEGETVVANPQALIDSASALRSVLNSK